MIFYVAVRSTVENGQPNEFITLANDKVKKCIIFWREGTNGRV